MDYRDNRQRWAESHQVVHFYAGQWCTFTPALTGVRLTELELIDRERRMVERRIRQARFPAVKSLDSFDFKV